VPESDLEDAIRENAAGPASASGDSGSVTQHNLKDQIEADRYLKAKAGAALPRRGLRFSKVIPPGAE
jgi:hypothetical protein